MTIGEAIILGLVQGIAEFLPISSSGHLAILQNLFNMSDIEGGHMLFDVLLHFGTLIAICFMYWSDIKAMVVEVLALLSGRKAVTADGRPKQYTAARMFFLIVAATLPLVLILPINDYIGELSQSTVFVGIGELSQSTVFVGIDDSGHKDREKYALFRCTHHRPVSVCCDPAGTFPLGNDDNRRHRNGAKPWLCGKVLASDEHSGGLGRNAFGAYKGHKDGHRCIAHTGVSFRHGCRNGVRRSGDRTPQNDSEEQALRRLCLLLLDSRRTHDNSFHDILIKAGIA